MNDLDLNSQKRPSRSHQVVLWVVLLLVAAIPRVIGAFVLPNEEGDPYAYAQAVDMMRATIVDGTFTLAELFGFWLPLYQFICALISAVVGHPLYVAKLFSALCGTGVCLLVFSLSLRLTGHRTVSLLAFSLIALNPIHIMYSAFSMSDIPHALLVMSSLYFAINNRWVVAASFVAAGGLMRPESWLFIALLPALQWVLYRKVSVIAFLLTVSSPLLWIYISWAATRNPLEYFNVRRDYIRELLAADPGLADLSLTHILANLKTLLYSTGPAVLIACLIAVWLLVKRTGREPNNRGLQATPVVVTAAYFFSSLGFLLLAYFTKNQPSIFARYCLVLFALGLPIVAWTILAARTWKPAWALSLSALVIALCLWQFIVQLRDGAAFVSSVSQKRIVANYLKDRFESVSNLKVFCDDDTIKTLTGIPADHFVGSSSSPRDSKSFLESLKERRVEFVVYELRNGSPAVSLFRDLGEERLNELFQLVASTNTELRLYRTLF
jgi:hypothetical protein